MSLIAITGGTGTLGQNLARTALARGHQVRIVSRRSDSIVVKGAVLAVANVLTGKGLDRALDGADVVIHAATSPFRRARVTEIDGTRQVAESAGRASAHLLYVSIVGVDRHRFPYYKAKFAAEQILARAKVSYSIARATQFHQLIDAGLGAPVFPVTANMCFQTIDPAEFAVRLCDLAEFRVPGPAPDFGGPQILSVREMRSIRKRTLGRAALLIPVPAIGFLADYDDGLHLAPDHRDGTVTYEQWLETRWLRTGQPNRDQRDRRCLRIR